MPERGPTWNWTSDRTLRLRLGETISERSHAGVRRAFEFCREARGRFPGLLDVTPAYTTLLLTFDARALGAPERAQIEQAAAEVLGQSAGAPAASPGRLIQIPVCYEGQDLAPDLNDVASLHGKTVPEVVTVHSAAEYTVHFVGFSPGFAYLFGLPEALNTPRLATPRVRVPAGSVGIGGAQTGVYPQETAGGWRLIGRTPLRMFDPERAEPCVLAMGDRVRFMPITRADFDRAGAAT